MSRGDSQVMNFLLDFVKDERGQDIIEYTLLVGFVAVVGIAVLSGAGSGLKGIWASGNSRLAAANTAVH